MRKVTADELKKFVKRPMFCEHHKMMTIHTIFYVGMSQTPNYVLYYACCDFCVTKEFGIQKNYFEQVLELDFLESDFVYETTVQEMNENDWRHLWIGDYYEKKDWAEAN